MATKKPAGKKKFKRTQFGQRALAGARSGTGGIPNPDGTRSSVRTATFDIPGKKPGRTDVMVAPTIRKVDGKLKRLTPPQAAKVAKETGDFVRVKGGKTAAKVQAARTKGDKKSKRFSKKLGSISAKKTKKK